MWQNNSNSTSPPRYVRRRMWMITCCEGEYELGDDLQWWIFTIACRHLRIRSRRPFWTTVPVHQIDSMKCMHNEPAWLQRTSACKVCHRSDSHHHHDQTMQFWGEEEDGRGLYVHNQRSVNSLDAISDMKLRTLLHRQQKIPAQRSCPVQHVRTTVRVVVIRSFEIENFLPKTNTKHRET